MVSSIGQQVVILKHGEIGPRIVLAVYSADEQSGYIMREGKRVQVKRVGYVDERKLKQLWQVAK